MGFYCVDAFAGAGGLSLGLRNAGFELFYAFDSSEAAVHTYSRNLGRHVELRAIENVTAEHVIRQLPRRTERLDILAGGPPCQGFSKQKRGAHNGDERNRLVVDFARLVDEVRPKFFLLENVAMLGQKRGKSYTHRVIKHLSNAYRFYPHFYNSADYGLAQTRERFVIVGEDRNLPPRFAVPKPTVGKWRTVGDVLAGLPEPPEDHSEHSEFRNHYSTNVTEAHIERFSYVPEGGGWQDIPMHLRLPCHQTVDVRSGGWPDVYGRLRWMGQCPTITGGFDNVGRGRFGHPKANRAITAREAARLQGFPDEFVFEGNRKQVRFQIGNAVPPPLAEAIGRQILAALTDESPIHSNSLEQQNMFDLLTA